MFKSEFGEENSDEPEMDQEEEDGGDEEKKVLNMSNRPPGDLSIQDVIIQQLQQRLVSQP